MLSTTLHRYKRLGEDLSYFHVLVSFRDAPKKVRCIYSDLSLARLEKQFLKPYRSGRSTLAGAEVIDVRSIASTRIVETLRTIEMELKDIQDRSWRDIEEFNRQSDSVLLVSVGRGHDNEDISEAGTDVTSRFISAPPGQQVPWNFSKIVNHQWVVAILGGLAVAGVAAWMGWG